MLLPAEAVVLDPKAATGLFNFTTLFSIAQITFASNEIVYIVQ